MEGVSLWLAVGLFFVLQSAAARASEEPGTGELRLVAPGGQIESALTLNTDYRVRVSGMLADTRLQQTFRNASDDWREGTYVFPLPERASVYALQLRIGERVVVGEIRTREQAKQTYEKARNDGKQAAHVEQQRPNLFTTRVANIPPGETVTVELRYQQAVTYRDGEFEMRLPTTLTPRYMPGLPVDDREQPLAWRQGWAVPMTQVPDADEISPYTVNPNDVPAGSHQARVQLTLNAGLPIDQVVSPTHAVAPVWQGGQVQVTPKGGSITMDRDLVVRWLPKREVAPSAAVFHEQWEGEDFLLAMLVPGIDSGQALSRELILVVDTSGSMAGESIRQAREALLAGLDTLKAGDQFNIIQFNSVTSTLFDTARPVTPEYLRAARQYAANLRADGGTEMAPALDRALRVRHGDEVSPQVRQVLFMTDGAVGNERALFSQIRDQLGQSRLFTVGIGSAPNMHFMREAARFGRGTFTAVGSSAEVASQLGALLDRMAAPVLADVEASWSGGPEAYPEKPGDLFQGEPLLLIGRGQDPQGELTIQGHLPDGSLWQRTLSLDSAAPGQGLHRYWARQKIDQITDQRIHGVGEEQVRAEVTPLALKHGLVTPYTSFVAVDQTPVRTNEETMKPESVPTLLPAGSTPDMLRYPQTATPSMLLIIVGLSGLLPAIGVFLARRRIFE
ncbi:marine proteobacterial sortase target protein [Marinobacter nanhaiticus D15-8W]|uniref:Marine proteobacterial sortase target protein n=2 Tax=Marinobacter TaxID=2742 RepID=N6WV87_9GAMM|nr:marine proteobacterial sortase target protein [Marinobacter nanhaiticus D15-8W]BES73645.1 marine proteobacterial sortase target protein [Marinobacter nanhaiticus D15-8W]